VKMWSSEGYDAPGKPLLPSSRPWSDRSDACLLFGTVQPKEMGRWWPLASPLPIWVLTAQSLCKCQGCGLRSTPPTPTLASSTRRRVCATLSQSCNNRRSNTNTYLVIPGARASALITVAPTALKEGPVLGAGAGEAALHSACVQGCETNTEGAMISQRLTSRGFGQERLPFASC
jgi:hypothetical protein